MFSNNPLSSLPLVVKNLLIINGLMLLASFSLESYGFDLSDYLGLHHWRSDYFKPHQLLSYIFMHGGITHLIFNMFALFMFGRVLEQVWGAKRFLSYYLITGIGAGLIQLIVTEIRIRGLASGISAEDLNYIYENGTAIYSQNKNFIEPIAAKINSLINVSTVGASGSVFGILLAFGMLFPNTELMLLIPPIPIKAKYFVAFYGLFELYMGFANNPNDNVAHFAHLGGMLFGYILIKYWKKNTNNPF